SIGPTSFSMTSDTDKSLLSAELQEEEEEEFNRLLLQKKFIPSFLNNLSQRRLGAPESGYGTHTAAQNIQGSVPSPAESKPIRPLPGFCLKTHTSSGEKIFVNVCRSQHIPSPPDLTNEELACLTESKNASTFRIPMSLGEPHAEVDKKQPISQRIIPYHSHGRTVREIQDGHQQSSSHSCSYSFPDWRILKNRKFMGSILEQNICTKSKPIIQEMHSSSASAPEFTIVAEPSTSHPDRLVAKFSLPEMISVRNLELDLGEDRIVLRGHPELYHLDIFIPYSIVPEESWAQFHKETKVKNLSKEETWRNPYCPNVCPTPIAVAMSSEQTVWRIDHTVGWECTLRTYVSALYEKLLSEERLSGEIGITSFSKE
ncbi:hypothetical protein Chor_012732, partial [Crotalus horridus]